MMEMNLSDMFLITLNPLVQSCEATIDLIDVTHKVNACQTLVLHGSHQLLLVLYGFLGELVKIKSNLFEI